MSVFPNELMERLAREGVLAVLVIEREEDAVPLARALVAGGIRVVELTLRTPVALKAMERIRQEVPELMVGVGTILTPDQAEQVRNLGAAFGVAPGLNPRVVRAALECGLPFAPGVCTPSEVELALEQGCRLMKLFPAEPLGGLSYLRTLSSPFVHLGVRFIPLGGLHQGNAESYLKEPLVTALGGSWIAPKDRIDARDWEGIRRNAAAASQMVAAVRGAGAQG
jgi:2-dehydro-3-deoxyphosphogluconate aldolase/(4S)-4-hydroxy-2-oxoglutarate aldolase